MQLERERQRDGRNNRDEEEKPLIKLCCMPLQGRKGGECQKVEVKMQIRVRVHQRGDKKKSWTGVKIDVKLYLDSAHLYGRNIVP